MKKTLQYLISLTVAAVLVWFTFKDIDLNTLWEKIKQADYRWVALSAVMALVAHWSRAYRWVLMLEPMGYKPSVFRTTLAVLVGYGANLIFPRAGEVARCGTLNKLEDIPFEKSFGAVIAERLIDVLVLLLLIFLNFILEFDRLKDVFFNFFGEKFKNPLLLGGYALVGIGLIIVAYFVFKKNQERIAQNALYQKVAKIIGGFASGFMSVRNLKNPSAFIFHTILIWTMYFVMTYVLCFALPETANLSPLAALSIFVMGSIGMAAPTQGGIGSYHFLVGSIVVLYGLSEQDGITLATFLHAMQGMVFVAVFGIIAFLLTLVLPKRESINSKYSKSNEFKRNKLPSLKSESQMPSHINKNKETEQLESNNSDNNLPDKSNIISSDGEEEEIIKQKSLNINIKWDSSEYIKRKKKKS